MLKAASASQKNHSPLLRRKQGFGYYLQRDWQLYLLVMLPLAFVIVFKYLPMTGLVIAFKDYKIARGFWGSEWAGLQVFQDLFAKPDFIRAVRNTLLLNVLDLCFSFTMPIVLALLLNEIKSVRFKRINQTVLYLPHFLSWVIIGAIAYQLLSEGAARSTTS